MKSLADKCRYKYYLFDLDGTISESAPGVQMSLEGAIKSLGKPVPDLSDYTLYIGPPLIDTFRNICGFNENDCMAGIEAYRNLYSEKGKYENKLYDGIADVFAALRECGGKIAVCSSKYERFAEEIAAMLGIDRLLDAVCGSTLYGSRKDKKDLIPYSVAALGGSLEADRAQTVMIGDTYFDARGARQCGVDFVGVKYGYGSLEAMKNEGAAVFAETPYDLKKLLLG